MSRRPRAFESLAALRHRFGELTTEPLRARLAVALFLSFIVGCNTSERGVDSSAAAGLASSVDSEAQLVAAGPLAVADFRVGALSDSLDSLAVRRILGVPDSVHRDPHPFDVGAILSRAHYHDITVDYNPDGRVVGLALVTPRFATLRGLRVADSVARVLTLYGSPRDTTNGEWEFAASDSTELHVMRVFLVRGRVARIFLGWLMD